MRWWRTQSQSNQSPPLNSLLTGKRTGYLLELQYLKKFSALIWEQTQRFIAEFPTLQNKELFWKNREFWCSNRKSNPAFNIRSHTRFFVHTVYGGLNNVCADLGGAIPVLEWAKIRRRNTAFRGRFVGRRDLQNGIFRAGFGTENK